MAFTGAEGILGPNGKSIDIGAIEAGHVDGGDDIARQHPAQGFSQANLLGFQRTEIKDFTKAALGLIAVYDIEELFLLHFAGWSVVNARFLPPILGIDQGVKIPS